MAPDRSTDPKASPGDAIRVYYPHGGRRRMLHWWTYNERGHVVLAKSRDGLLGSARRIFAENPDAEIRVYAEIVLVAPSEKLQEYAADQKRRERVSRFHVEVAARLSEVALAGLPLPAPFEVCASFESEYDDEPNEWARERHSGCKNCLDKIRAVGLTPGDLYARYHAAWALAMAEHGHWEDRIDPKFVPSRAEPARDGEPLWCAVKEFGDHAGGCKLLEVGEPDMIGVGGYGYSFVDDKALFFFRKCSDLDPAELESMLALEKQAAERAQAERERERVAAYERDKRQSVDAVVRFFAEHG